MENNERFLAKKIADLDVVLVKEGLLQSQYNGIQAIISPEVKEINSERKNNREMAETILADCGDSLTACAVANALLPTMRVGAEASERKRQQRCRDWLKARLSRVFPQYDFKTDGSKLVAVWVGSASMRIAREWKIILEKVSEYGLSFDSSIEEIAGVIAATEREAGTGVAVHDDINPDVLAAIADRISGIQARRIEDKMAV